MGICQVCRQTEDWHQEYKPQHRFVPEGEAPMLERATVTTPTPQTRIGGDLVLRLALIQAGVITQDQIEVAQIWFEQARNSNMALVVDPDPLVPGKLRYVLLDVHDLIKRQVG